MRQLINALALLAALLTITPACARAQVTGGDPADMLPVPLGVSVSAGSLQERPLDNVRLAIDAETVIETSLGMLVISPIEVRYEIGYESGNEVHVLRRDALDVSKPAYPGYQWHAENIGMLLVAAAHEGQSVEVPPTSGEIYEHEIRLLQGIIGTVADSLDLEIQRRTYTEGLLAHAAAEWELAIALAEDMEAERNAALAGRDEAIRLYNEALQGIVDLEPTIEALRQEVSVLMTERDEARAEVALLERRVEGLVEQNEILRQQAITDATRHEADLAAVRLAAEADAAHAAALLAAASAEVARLVALGHFDPAPVAQALSQALQEAAWMNHPRAREHLDAAVRSAVRALSP
jgi:hypothetical protein